MDNIVFRLEEKKTIIVISGRVDSNNAHEIEEKIMNGITGREYLPVIIDAENLNYISSAGLRILLHLKKTVYDLAVTNVNSDVYEIFDMTGFTQMMTVEKAYRVVSVEGCEEIGRGANGTIYRIDQDNVVKVYNNPDALDEIQHEREVARTALVLGIPTAISYDVVKVGDSYGSVFELLNARSFSKILAAQPEKMDWCVREYVKMLKKIHGTIVPDGQLPDIKETVVSWARFMQDYLPKEAGDKLLALVEAVPQDNHMIHGDYHTKNLELQDDEVLLIDMDTLAVGNPVFELASMYNAYVGYYECDHEAIKAFQGFDYETAQVFWHKSLAAYLGTNDPSRIEEVENKARIIGYTRLIRRSIRRGGLEDEGKKAEIEHWTKELTELLEETDTLTFLRNELVIDAEPENLKQVQDFIDEHLDAAGCAPKERMQIQIAAEEIFVNIASYAYAPAKGKATVCVEVSNNPLVITLTFIDNGFPFNPILRENPDISATAADRDIGGLGIFMTKKFMDDIYYEFKDGKNILRLKKDLN